MNAGVPTLVIGQKKCVGNNACFAALKLRATPGRGDPMCFWVLNYHTI